MNKLRLAGICGIASIVLGFVLGFLVILNVAANFDPGIQDEARSAVLETLFVIVIFIYCIFYALFLSGFIELGKKHSFRSLRIIPWIIYSVAIIFAAIFLISFISPPESFDDIARLIIIINLFIGILYFTKSFAGFGLLHIKDSKLSRVTAIVEFVTLVYGAILILGSLYAFLTFSSDTNLFVAVARLSPLFSLISLLGLSVPLSFILEIILFFKESKTQ